MKKQFTEEEITMTNKPKKRPPSTVIEMYILRK